MAYTHALADIDNKAGGGGAGGLTGVSWLWTELSRVLDGAQEPGLWEGGHARMCMSGRWANPHTGR